MTVTTLGYNMVICGHSDDLRHRYRGRIEKVKFGVPIQEAFSHDIPATLLVLLLKVNKEGPIKKDIWRAPGNQAQVRKLAHVMQHGRLVNIANFSVYTAASVIKKFLSKLPGGIFGLENETRLFAIVEQEDPEKQRELFCRVISGLPVPSQHFLALLFGTFRMIADSAEAFGTRMSPEAIGVSVAPSLFHTCIHDGQRAKIEDVVRFRIASEVVTKIIKGFGFTNLFPRECYEFYARITGRTLRVDDNWLFTFQYPARTFSQPEVVVTPAGENGEPGPSGLSHVIIHRLSSSVGEAIMHSSSDVEDVEGRSDEEDRRLKRRSDDFVESTRSLTYLEWVHERQTRRMHTRSEWFLSPELPAKNGGSSRSADFQRISAGDEIVQQRNGSASASSRAAASALPSVVKVSAGGVVRRRSWRTHYVRPHKSYDQESLHSQQSSATAETDSPSSTPQRRPTKSSMGTTHRSLDCSDVRMTPSPSAGGSQPRHSLR